MAKNYNPSRVDVEKAREGILNAGGGESTRNNYDGSIHHTVYLKNENRHISYDEYDDGRIEHVHSDKDGQAYYDYDK